METILRIDTVSEHDKFYHQNNLHPLVSVIDFTGTRPKIPASKMNFGFYAVYLKDVQCGDIKYCRHTYDYKNGTFELVPQERITNLISTNITNQKVSLCFFHQNLSNAT